MSDDDARIPDRLFFRIGEVADLVGVESHVLRYWETEFRMRPQRSDSGQRMYQRRDISRFLKIRRLLHDEGFTIAGARKALSDASSDGAVDVASMGEVAERLRGLRDRVAALRAELDRPIHQAAGPQES